MSVAGAELRGELLECRNQLEALDERAHALISGMMPAQLFWRPAPETWSVGECVLHVALTNRGMLPGIDRSIERARAKGLVGGGPYRHGRLGALFVRMLEPPGKMRVKTKPWAIPPVVQKTPSEVETEFRAAHAEVIARLERARDLDLGRARVRSPFLPLFHYSLGQAFAIIAAHGRRHLWQAEQVRANPGFPRS